MHHGRRLVTLFSGGAAPRMVLVGGAIIDTDTIVASDLASAHWQNNSGSQVVASAANVGDYTLLNNALATDATLWRCHQFVAPAGCTQVTVTYEVRTGVDADSSHQIQVATASRTGTPATTDTARTLTDTATEYSFNQAVSAGTEYMVIFYLNNGVVGTGNRCRVSGFSVSINAGSGVFASSFQRIVVDAGSLDLCSPLYPPEYVDDAHVRGTSFSRVRMKTDQTAFAVEYRDAIVGGSRGDIGLRDEYVPVDHIAITAEDQAYIGTLDGIGSGRRVVDVVNGAHNEGGAADLHACMARAVYLADPLVTVYKTQPDAVFFGDSLIAGGGIEVGCNDGVTNHLQSETADVVNLGSNGANMKNYCATAGDRTAQAALMASFGAHKYWIEHCLNDFAMTQPAPPWNASDFGDAYADLVDKIKAADPLAEIVCQTAAEFTDESANDWGDTLDDYRAEITAVVAARSSFCTEVDGEVILTYATDFMADGTHPHPAGQSVYADGIRAEFGSPFDALTPVLSEAEAEYQFNDGDLQTLLDYSGNSHYPQLGTDPDGVDSDEPTWAPAGYHDFATPDGDMVLPATYKTAVGTGSRTYVAVVQINATNYTYIFGSDTPGDGMMLFTNSTTRQIQGAARLGEASVGALDPVATSANTWVYVMLVYEAGARLTLWSTRPGSLTEVIENSTSVPASLDVITDHHIGNDNRLGHGLNKIAFAATITGAVSDANAPGIYAKVKAAMALKPTPIVLP